MPARWRKPPLPALLRSAGRAWRALPSASEVVPVALVTPGAVLPSAPQARQWSWLQRLPPPVSRALPPFLWLHPSANLSVNQRRPFQSTGRAIVRVMLVFSLPLSFFTADFVHEPGKCVPPRLGSYVGTLTAISIQHK